ncbi:MAG: ThuA domain-containing protein, partial [Gammaproteobacteria bacterium]|nr:ThuA domain-containing protein [Gammaproteobacteria bacterium]
FDVLMLYGNRNFLPAEQERALLDYVDGGGGFVAIHSASASFLNSDAFTNLVGGTFVAHGVGEFSADFVAPDHPVLAGLDEIESWDESYIHTAHNPDKTVLSVRREDGHEEPWTWVRTQGDGRVFYTAWGHDERTWTNDGFQALLARALRWTAGDWALDADLSPPPLTYNDGTILPYYPPNEAWSTQGDPITAIQDPLSPADSIAHMMLDPEFDVHLVAAEPDIANPVDLTWDERGRLWILETLDYPNDFAEGRVGNDRIRILEDTDGDGMTDTSTVFADGLNIATSLVLANGGVIVTQAPDVFFLRDTDGDDVADERDVLFTGWQSFDTHAGPNNLRYGFDNQIWGTVGYSGMDGGVVGGIEHTFNQGIFRFAPDASSLELMSHTNNNTWGLGFDEEGRVYASTANGVPVVHHVIPQRFYDAVRGTLGRNNLPDIATSNRIFPLPGAVRQVDWHGRYTAGSGFEVYTARSFPPSYSNRVAFVSEPTGHLMGRFALEQNGSTMVAENDWNFVASHDEWFSPIQAKVGPDGALWFIDVSNIVIQHNPPPVEFEQGEGNAYESPYRDTVYSRIYRVTWKDGELDTAMTLADATPDELLAALSHSNLFWRLTAQRLLVERGDTDVLPALYALVRDESVDGLGLNPAALHALWTIDGLTDVATNADAYGVAVDAFYHPARAVRHAALEILPRTAEVRDLVLGSGILANPDRPGGIGYRPNSGDPSMIVAALLALAETPVSAEATRAAAETVWRPANVNDRWIRDAAIAAGAHDAAAFVAYMLEKQVPDNASPEYSENIAAVVTRVTRHYAAGEPAGEIDALISSIENLADDDDSLAAAYVTGFAEGWPDFAPPSLTDAQVAAVRNARAELPEVFHESLELLAEKWEIGGLPQ